MTKKIYLLILALTIPLIIVVLVLILPKARGKPQQFSGEQAFSYVKYQVDLGPRTLGSTAHEQTVNWLVSELKNQHWNVEVQETQVSGQTIKNIIAMRGQGSPWIILGSHYDSRPVADRDPNPQNRTTPILGANDGASSTAILLELARVIPENLNKQIWLVFFDAEDAFGTNGPALATGSEYFVSQLQGKPDNVVILDMLGDKNLGIYMEGNSNHQLNDQIWSVAKQLGYSQFIAQYKYDLLDDHIPFIQAGINAVDLIDFDYPAWHTTADTIDKISPHSLKVVGDTVLKWLEEK